MSEDDNNSELEELRIDQQRRKLLAGDHFEHRTKAEQPGMYKRILEALIVAAVVALTASVWNLTNTMTLLQTSQDKFEKSTLRDIDRIERRQDSLEGKLTRGGPDVANADQ